MEEGIIGWVNELTIINKESPTNAISPPTLTTKYLSNQTYQGSSIVDALKQINIDSSYNNRKKIANLNNINNYQGTKEQNTNLLNLLKQGKLKSQ